MTTPQEVPDQPVANRLADKCERLAEWEPCDCGCPSGKSPKTAKDVALIQAAAALRRPTPAAADLHQQIINLPCKLDPILPGDRVGYKLGHRDARHAAAQLVAASPAAAAEMPTSAGICLQTSPADDEMSTSAGPGVPTGEHPAEEALRSLACWLGVGGYNAPTVDVPLYEKKIREGFAIYSQLHGFAARDLAEQVLHMDMVTPKGIRARELARAVLGLVPLASPVAPVGAPTLTDEQIDTAWQQAIASASARTGGVPPAYVTTDLDTHRGLRRDFARALLSAQGCELATEPRTQSAPPAPCESEVPPPRTDDSAPQEQWLDRYPTYCGCQLCLAAQSRL